MNPLHKCCWDLYQHFMDTVKVRTALDIGANDGGYTRTLLRHGFFVHAFEPVPDRFEAACFNIRNEPNWESNATVFNVGLSDTPGVIKDVTVLEAWTIGRPGMSGLDVNPSYHGHPVFNMTTAVIDRLYFDNAPDSGINLRLPQGVFVHVGLIKLDVDGYEAKVLRGGMKTIARDRPPILCELSKYIRCCGDEPQAMLESMFMLGYVVASMDGQYIARTWAEVEPYYPWNTSFDVMLVPEEKLP